MDYFLNKVLKRYLTALFGPLSLYAAFFGLGRLIGQVPQSINFFNMEAIQALIGVSVVFSRIGLWITLRPIEKLFDRKLWIAPGKNFALKGNFAPI